MESKKNILDKIYNNVYIIAAVILLALIIVSGVMVGNYIKSQNIKEDVLSQFTCTCCNDNTLLETGDSCFMAGGMREYVGKLVSLSNNKEEIMIEATKKFGVSYLTTQELQEQYGLILINDTENTPEMHIEPEEFDLGTVSNSKGIIISDFTIKNNGTEDLIMTDLKTSCSCLTASFIKDGKESVRVGRFSHSEGWTFVLQPNEEAFLRTYYDPRVTNWQTGHVERIVTITSNDPVFFERTVKVTAELVA